MSAKILSIPALASLSRQLKHERKTVALANGCFDLIHVGHIRYLYGAKKVGDILVVAVNSDLSVKKIKGPHRPIIPLEERLEILQALEMVDYLVPFDETTPEKVIRALKPDYQCKGTDYTPETVPERQLVEALGGKVVIVGDPKEHATTDLIQRIKELYGL